MKMKSEKMILQLNVETTKVLTILINSGVPFKLIFFILFLQCAFSIGPSQKILKIWKPPYIGVFIPNVEKYVPCWFTYIISKRTLVSQIICNKVR